VSTPRGELTGDTAMQGGRPPLAPVMDSYARPQPTDPPGSTSAGWRKTDATGPGGWDAIDDAEGANGQGWRQC